MIEYKELVYDERQIINLYLNNEWYAYTNNKDKLFQGIKHSLFCMGAYDDNRLIGMIRVVGDGSTIIYIQDILVYREYQKQGIGTVLLNKILEKYSNVRQILLMTDKTDTLQNFYEKNGFVKVNEVNLISYKYRRNNG